MHRPSLTRADLDGLLGFPATHAQAGYHTPPEGVRYLFEAGLPDPELFPLDDLVRLSEKVLREEFVDPGDAVAIEATDMELRTRDVCPPWCGDDCAADR